MGIEKYLGMNKLASANSNTSTTSMERLINDSLLIFPLFNILTARLFTVTHPPGTNMNDPLSVDIVPVFQF